MASLGSVVASATRSPKWEAARRAAARVGSCPAMRAAGSPEIVVYKNKDTEIIGYSDADSSSRFSDAKVGYTRAQIHQENDLDPATYAHAAQKARQYLALQMDHHIERSITCMYFPVRQGEIVQLTINGKTTKYLAINVERNFSDMTVGLTLREA